MGLCLRCLMTKEGLSQRWRYPDVDAQVSEVLLLSFSFCYCPHLRSWIL